MIRQDKSSLIIAKALVEPGMSDLMRRLSSERPEVFRHSLNVAHLVAEICYAELDADMDSVTILDKMNTVRGALLHDIGKLWIPKDILYKTTKLSEKEKEIIKTHPKIGYEKVLEYEREHESENITFSDTVKDIILHHHEKPDGTGYPDGKCKLNMSTKLVSLCDKYDAMTENRPYRPAIPIYNTYQTLSEDDIDKNLFLLLVSCTTR